MTRGIRLAVDAGSVRAGLGRSDPDGNTFSFLACKAALNYPKYCSPEADAALQAERGTVDPAKRKAAWKAESMSR